MCLPDPPPKMSLMAAQRTTVSSACRRALGASREYAAPWCDQLRSRLGRRVKWQVLLGAGTSATDSALEKPHRCACDRRNDYHHYNSEHKAGHACTNCQHLPGAVRPNRYNLLSNRPTAIKTQKYGLTAKFWIWGAATKIAPAEIPTSTI